MISGTLQLPCADLSSLLGVQLAQKVNHEPEVHPVPWRDTQPLSQVTALPVSRAPGVPLAALAQGSVWCPFTHTVLYHTALRAQGWIMVWL